ncbi:MAG TPA: hypothetical protein VFH11_02490 [Gemmatimonadota bacterium]|nr:hypothetical protein [Gemmatimonadota bacterium]
MRVRLSIPYVIGALSVSVPCAAQTPKDSWLGPDKPVHAFAAGWTTGAGYAAALELEWAPADRRLAGIGAALAASLGKEARDWTRGEPFSFKDLAADAIGIVAVVALTALADR